MQTLSRYWFEIVELPRDGAMTAVAERAHGSCSSRTTRTTSSSRATCSARRSRPRFELDWEPTYAPALRRDRARRRHDVYLVDYRLGEHTGLDLVRDARRRRPARAGDPAHRPGRLRGRPRGHARSASPTTSSRASSTRARLERSIRYAVRHHQRRSRAAPQRGALRARRARRQRRHLGLGPASRDGIYFSAALEGAARLRRRRSRHDPGGVVRPRPPRRRRAPARARSTPTSPAAARTSRTSTASATPTAAGAGC